MDPLKLAWKAGVSVTKAVHQWAWKEPADARGWAWTLLLWVAVGAAIYLLYHALIAMIVYCAARWAMAKIGKPKLPARPVYRR